jgi:hypothetical protein
MKKASIATVLLLGIMLVSGIACGETTYELSTVVEGQGSISPSNGTYTDGVQLTLTAIPAYGWSFDHWGGHISGIQNPITITMDSSKTVYAYFISGPTPTPTPTANWWNTYIHASEVAVPYGNHIYAYETEVGISSRFLGRVNGHSGYFDYHREDGEEGVEQASGRVYLEGAPLGTAILIISPAYYGTRGQLLPQDIQEAFNTDFYLDDCEYYYDYEVVVSGQSWLLQSREDLDSIVAISPGYVVASFENPAFGTGERIVLPDVTLPEEWVVWDSPPPVGVDWYTWWALYAQSAY